MAMAGRMASAVGQHRRALRGGVRGDRVVAVQARDLLDEVLLDREIEAIRRRRHEEIVAGAREGEAQPTEERRRWSRPGTSMPRRRATRAGRTRIGVACGQRALHVGQAARRGRRSMSRISCVARSTARAQPVEIDAALEAIAGVAREAEAPRLALDDRGIPEGAFEQHASSSRR